MIHLTDAQIDNLIDFPQAIAALESAFRELARGAAAVQRRVRTKAQGTKLSTLGAVLPGADVAGAKVYTTLRGQFNFVIVLFRASDGACLATLDANAITRLRTAATTILAVRALARPGARTAAIFGSGVQGAAHAHALARFAGVQALRIVGIEGDVALAASVDEAPTSLSPRHGRALRCSTVARCRRAHLSPPSARACRTHARQTMQRWPAPHESWWSCAIRRARRQATY